jgi:hypothetical protein
LIGKRLTILLPIFFYHTLAQSLLPLGFRLVVTPAAAEVMAVTGYSRGWIYELVWGYNHLGPESLGDQRCQNTDADPLLNDVEQAMVVASPTAATP